MWLSNGSFSRSGSKPRGDPFNRRQDREGLQSSVASLLLLRLPNAFLLYGVACFLVGFGLFLGFAWRQNLANTPSRDNNFAVMLLFVVVGAVSFLGAGGLVKWKMGEVDLAEKSIGKDIEEGDGHDGDGHGRGDVDGNRSQADDSDGEGETDGLLGKKTRGGKYSPKEVMDHERIANALEDAAKAHRELATLMKNALQKSGDD